MNRNVVVVLVLLLAGTSAAVLAYWLSRSPSVSPAVEPAIAAPVVSTATDNSAGSSMVTNTGANLEPVTEPVDGEEGAQAPVGSGEVAAPPPSLPPESATDAHAHEPVDDAMQLPPETAHAIRELRKPAEGEGQVTEHPDGTKELNLGNRYRSVPVATVGPDGKVRVNYHGESLVPPETTPGAEPAAAAPENTPATPSVTGEQQP